MPTEHLDGIIKSEVSVGLTEEMRDLLKIVSQAHGHQSRRSTDARKSMRGWCATAG